MLIYVLLPADQSLELYRHTVEEFQSYFKSRGISLHWVNVVCALVLLCDPAAAPLMKFVAARKL